MGACLQPLNTPVEAGSGRHVARRGGEQKGPTILNGCVEGY